MKWILYIFLSVILSVSCGPDSVVEENVKLSTDIQSLEFPAEGGDTTVVVTASGKFYLVPANDWVSCRKGKEGENHTTEVIISASENVTEEDRTTRISVVADEQSVYIDVIQAGVGKNEEPGPGFPIPEDNEAWKMAQKLGMGWNLGNHFDAYNNGVSGETYWGNPKATPQTFKMVKAAGFKTVRIPVTWLGHFGAAPDYKIEGAWLERVAEVVGYARDAGLNVIINMHHDGADSKYWLDISSAALNASVQQKIVEQIDAMWTQIAERFKDEGEYLIFEAFNEIHDGKWGWGANRTDGGKQYACLHEWNQTFVDAVRAVGGKNTRRYLGIPAYCTNADLAVQFLKLPTDKTLNRMLVSVHCYDPTEYTLTAKYSEWGHTADQTKKAPGDNEESLKKTFDTLYDNYVSKGIPVYLGEFGCVNRSTAREQSFQQYYLRYFAKLAQTKGIPCIIWDNGAKGAGNEKHAFIDHGSGAYCSAAAQAAIEGMIDSYTNSMSLNNVYRTAPK